MTTINRPYRSRRKSLSCGRCLFRFPLPLQFALDHLIPAHSKPSIGIDIEAVHEQADSPAERNPEKPEMMRIPEKIDRGEEETDHEVNQHVTIESKDRFNPRRGPPIRYVVHRGNCIMPFHRWRALNRRGDYSATTTAIPSEMRNARLRQVPSFRSEAALRGNAARSACAGFPRTSPD